MSFSVTILGSSSAIPTSKRNLTAHLVNHDERFFLIDCGEGTQIQLQRFRTKYLRINHIFISHLHGDHIFGLFGLISSLSMMGRKNTLHIYSPGKIKDLLHLHFAFMGETLNYEIEFHELDAKVSQEIYDDGKLIVTTIPLRHRVPCVGYCFREHKKPLNIRKECIERYQLGIKDIVDIKQGADFVLENGKVIPNKDLTTEPVPPKSYAFCSDTKALQRIVPYIANVDLLYHESTFLNEDAKLAKATYHTTTGQAAQLALEANVKKLVIGHLSSRYKDESRFIKEVRDVFPNAVMAEDGMVIEV
jgi:ribonuclease Z